jgi:hypothetical protein
MNSLSDQLQANGSQPEEVVRLLRTFNGYAPEFRVASLQIESASNPKSPAHG